MSAVDTSIKRIVPNSAASVFTMEEDGKFSIVRAIVKDADGVLTATLEHEYEGFQPKNAVLECNGVKYEATRTGRILSLKAVA